MNYHKNICSEIFAQHSAAEDYKCGIGRKGLFEQIKQNRRFYKGDQWYGAKTGADKPLVTNNVVRRIGDYKTAVVGGEKIKVSFSPIGVSSISLKEAEKRLKSEIMNGDKRGFDKLSDEEILLASKAVSQYFNNCINRLHFDDICMTALKNAYITGTGIVYVYWDCNVKTGLFADDKRTVPIMGDICAEVIDIENVDYESLVKSLNIESDFVLDKVDLSIIGICKKCKENL